MYEWNPNLTWRVKYVNSYGRTLYCVHRGEPTLSANVSNVFYWQDCISMTRFWTNGFQRSASLFIQWHAIVEWVHNYVFVGTSCKLCVRYLYNLAVTRQAISSSLAKVSGFTGAILHLLITIVDTLLPFRVVTTDVCNRTVGYGACISKDV